MRKRFLITGLLLIPAILHLTAVPSSALPASGTPAIDAQAAVAMEAESGRVLYAKNATTRRSIASTTKIMTAIVALENGKLEDEVTVSRRAAGVGGSSINLRTGERLTLKELLYGLLLNSGNDAAIAIAEHIGGTVERFVGMMNSKAIWLGAADTHYATPHGLDSDGQYCTAYDLALITRYAMKNPVFARIVGTNYASITGRQLYNTNELLEIYRGADGVKTGYTGRAGRCLVASAVRGGMRIITVVLGSPTRYKRAESSKAILDYSFSNYSMYDLVRCGMVFKRLPVLRGAGGSVSLRAAGSVRLPLREDEYEALEERVHLPDSFDAPIYAGADAGYVEYLVDGRVIGYTELKTWENVRRMNFFDYFSEVFGKWGTMMREGIFMDMKV